MSIKGPCVIATLNILTFNIVEVRENGNIKVDLRQIDCDCVNGTEETQGMAQICVYDGQ